MSARFRTAAWKSLTDLGRATKPYLRFASYRGEIGIAGLPFRLCARPADAPSHLPAACPDWGFTPSPPVLWPPVLLVADFLLPASNGRGICETVGGDIRRLLRRARQPNRFEFLYRSTRLCQVVFRKSGRCSRRGSLGGARDASASNANMEESDQSA